MISALKFSFMKLFYSFYMFDIIINKFYHRFYYLSLAQKQKAAIMKMVDKATNYTTYKKMAREDLGDSVKYIQITTSGK